MCGIAGGFTFSPFDSWQEALPRMTGALAHRGPDADGHWFDSAAGIALGHRRLSIIDLSAAGAQPMISRSGRYVIVFNGEIYNHNDIRKQLETDGKTLSWLGHSDTETLLAAIEAWGLEKTLQNCTGMFAIALWDRTDRKLSLARDRIGEKPLYYGLQNRTFMFGSELKAIRLAPGFRGEIDRDVLALYFQFNAVPDPYCIYRGFHKLRPGCILSIDVSQLRNGTVPEVQPYWSLADVCRSGINSPFIGTDAEAVAKLEKLIAQSIAEQSIADVPLGAFLSGGVDSSAIVAMMQAQSNHRVKTFTIGFTEDAYNEAEHAKAVALHLGTDHHELYVSPQQALDVIPKLPHMYCEPFADSSQIPTFLVSQLARQHVTVSLSGDAGDELFGGYNRYQTAEDYWRRISRTPAPIRGLLVAGIRSLSVEQWNQLIAAVRWVLPSKLKNYANGKRAHVLAELMSQQDIGNFYRQLVTHWRLDSGLVNYQRELPSVYSNCAVLPVDIDGKQRLMAKDILGYLCTDILVKVDRAAMATSLETRVPLLDPRIVEFSQSLPLHLKMRGGQTKWILRELLYKHVPRKLIERPKMGFGVPIGPWLRGPLRDWAENLLSVEKLSEQGLINPDPVRDKWFQHLAGSHNWEYLLWDVLMFQAWLDDQMLTA